ncbi:MAG: hypothetical protein A2W03_16165 [Candidatus Aminicenantes bacterium RBG_16_63_16]|nr:MAG: hypothetical protein A2W03_16165 [Candidatus Aminicenantes bacterium RBG_16_63_16]
MNSAGAGPGSAWPLLVYALLVIFLVAAIIAISSILGQRRSDREPSQPYESGVSTTGSARLRFSVRFYLVAMFFVIFDIAAVFLFAWAVAFRELGWEAYIGVLVFSLMLLLMIFYLGRSGGLDFVARPKRTSGPPGAPEIPLERR